MTDVDKRMLRRSATWPIQLAGTFIAASVIGWMIYHQGLQPMWQAVRSSDVRTILIVLPLIAVNLGLRSLRWRVLLVGDQKLSLWPVFSALTIGFLANNVFPARGGDLVRAWVLGNSVRMSKSRLFASIVVERVLEAAVIFVGIGTSAAFLDLPLWMRNAGIVLACGTTVAVASLLVFTTQSVRLFDAVLDRSPLSPAIHERLRAIAHEFGLGAMVIRRADITASFVFLTAMILALEIGVAIVVGRAFQLDLSMSDGWILILFAAASSFVPALPGQLGAFEVAVVFGLDALRLSGTSALPFAFAWHFVVLFPTSLLGALCLIFSRRSFARFHAS